MITNDLGMPKESAIVPSNVDAWIYKRPAQRRAAMGWRRTVFSFSGAVRRGSPR